MTVGDEILQKACDDLLVAQQALQLATCSVIGEAEIGYAPFVHESSSFYIFVSELAKHTRNLRSHPQVSVLLLEAEGNAKSPFARRRLTLNCIAHEIYFADSRYDHLLDAMEQKFGNVVQLLRRLPDFSLWELAPQQGIYVAGFGQAIIVDAQLRLQIGSEFGA